MNPDMIVQRVLAELQDYTVARHRAVAAGRETPELAGLIVQHYGYGLVKATILALEDEEGGMPATTGMLAAVDAAVASLDPHWRATQEQRWAARPARLAYE
jgi:hypothetical protein